MFIHPYVLPHSRHRYVMNYTPVPRANFRQVSSIPPPRRGTKSKRRTAISSRRPSSLLRSRPRQRRQRMLGAFDAVLVGPRRDPCRAATPHFTTTVTGIGVASRRQLMSGRRARSRAGGHSSSSNCVGALMRHPWDCAPRKRRGYLLTRSPHPLVFW